MIDAYSLIDVYARERQREGKVFRKRERERGYERDIRLNIMMVSIPDDMMMIFYKKNKLIIDDALPATEISDLGSVWRS